MCTFLLVAYVQEKLDKLQKSSHKKAAELEDELAQVAAYKDELQKYIRELEQANDDLERAKRYALIMLTLEKTKRSTL